MVFLQHDGVPSLDMLFDGPYGVYHSVYDDYEWMARIGDPGFRYHAAMSRLWGLLALRYANADLVPFDYAIYATEVTAYLESLEQLAPPDFFGGTLRPLIKKCAAWRAEGERMNAQLEAWRRGVGEGAVPPAAGARPLPAQAAAINERLMGAERALLEEKGIPGRPWFRHLIYAPLPSYEAETLPGLREALEAHDLARARDQAGRLANALDRAIAASRAGPVRMK